MEWPLVSENEKVEVKGTEIKAKPVPSDPVEMMAEIDALGLKLRELIVRVKRVPKKSLEPHQDQTRSLSLAQANMQAGFMWLRRAVEQPNNF